MYSSRSPGFSALLAVAFFMGLDLPVPCLAMSTPEFEQRYDRFKDYTSLKVDLGRVFKDSRHEVELSFHRTFRGEGRSAKGGTPRMCFNSDSNEGWVYLDYHPITLLVDGERMRFDAKHDGSIGKGYVLEFMWVDPSESQIERIFRANNIEGQVGIREFKLSSEQVAAIKEFATLCVTPDRPVPSGRFVAPPPPQKPKSPEEILREKEAQRREATRLKEEAERQQEESRRRQEAQLISKLDQKLKLGKSLEKSNSKAAIQYYKDVIALAPDSPQAKTATDRIRVLSPKK